MIVRLSNKIKRFFERKAIVLMYHRIADLDTDPWQLAVSPANFEQHLEILGKTDHLISAKNMVSKLHAGSIPHNAISLTFDDGYRDNFYAAKPLLEKYNCPATFFIASQYVDREQPFWWDELENRILNAVQLPAELNIEISGNVFEYRLKNEGTLTDDQRRLQKSWVWPHPPPTQRCELYLALWERLKPLPHDQIMFHLDQISTWAKYNYKAPNDSLAMTSHHIEGLVNNPLFDIGIHTITHPALSSHSLEVQRAEISGCKSFLEDRFKRAITTMAYPYGNYNHDTLRIAGDLSLAASFTTEEKYVTKNSGPYRLGRFQVKNWTGKEFEKQLRLWRKRI